MTKKKISKNVSKEKEEQSWNPNNLKEIKDEMEDKADEYQPSPETKPNKKLETLYNNLGDKWNRLNKYLTQQGLGQNARQKVVEFVKEIRAIEDDIAKEEE